MIPDDHMTDDELKWISQLQSTDGGVALLKWLDFQEARIDRQWLATDPSQIAIMGALQAKKHAYRQIRDLLTMEVEDEGTREEVLRFG